MDERTGYEDYKCPVCYRTGTAFMSCDYPGCADGRMPEPRIDFVATYRVPSRPRPTRDWLPMLYRLWFVIAIVCAFIAGWRFGSYLP